ncbi:ATP-binding cassette domain-containing protein [Oenococcus oeni]|uniref:ATP-binding cassette domain-containing protein n=2 Tax=Oenococcus oeni TaxID=1247 RepID=UPI000277B93D|nr:ATP-binding cassette domain-containing protein [Oenococcus oeni]KGO16256.1 cobalt ABC transporter [Oenococcus oeni X2L]EJN99725.1 ABC-type cobalt transport system, ATPase component [Oenococcus oeni AWRIB418]KDE87466.1 cobalt ABC transporter [Oenococcus oeni]KEP87731.1 cobalt ABC transporter [Oenococcus oeni IOEB_0501]KGH55105.1 cobalt ABC transporter [Oenococcus oeni S22]
MAIEFKQVNYLYKSFLHENSFSLNNLSLSINSGEFILVAGQTGSGKTTFLRLLDTLILPSNGEINFDGQIINNSSPEKILMKVRRNFGFVFQFPQRQLFSPTVLDDVEFAALNFGNNKAEASKKAKEVLKQIGIEEDLWEHSVFNLSVGQMRKVAIAGALVNQPKYLLLDEPTSGMDEYAKNDLLKILNYFHEQGATIIAVSHDINTFAPLVDRAIIFRRGKIISDNNPTKIFSKPMNADIQPPSTVSFARSIGLKSTPLSIDELADEIEAINE